MYKNKFFVSKSHTKKIQTIRKEHLHTKQKWQETINKKLQLIVYCFVNLLISDYNNSREISGTKF